MPTIPKRWPPELEIERERIEMTATESAQILLDAQRKIDLAKEKLISNPDLSKALLSDADRMMYDAWARLERVQRYLASCKRTPIDGRWPSIAARQRDEAIEDAQSAATILLEVQPLLSKAREQLRINATLVELMLIEVAHGYARALMLLERIARIMVEATLGRS